MRFLVLIPLMALAFLSSSLLVSAQVLSPAERAALEAEYAKVQQEIAEWQKVLTETQAKKNTLQGDVTLLNAQIKEAEAQIKKRGLAISELAKEISVRTGRIEVLSDRIEEGKRSLAALLRRKQETGSYSVVEVALSASSVSNFFADVDAVTTLERELQIRFAELRGTQTALSEERALLDKKRALELDARHEVETKKQQIAKDEADKQRLLSITKNEETSYQQILAERRKRAAEINARLFPLRDTEGIQFGEAVEYARAAAQKTGVRPAMILAILSQESDLGKNVGNCLVTNLTTGDGKGKNTGTPFLGVMKAPRDTVPFESITKQLGKDWSTTPVSCPQPGGYGGAMGPTQFIPSTWILFEARLKTALNVPATNPWNAGHAIMATGLYLQDVGAGAQTYTAERNAACRYYSGRACPGTGGAVDTYGTSVVNKATKFQQDIDFLADN